MVDRKEHLSEVLSEFARTLLTDFPIQSILDHLVMRIVDVMPVTAAGVTLITRDRVPHYVAASNEAALRYERLQTGLGEGPCLAAYVTGEAVAVADLRKDVRFPRFGPRALAEGLRAVFTFPLHHGDEQLGALDLYRDSPGRLDREAMVVAQTLADVAAAYLINAKARSDLQDSSDQFERSALHDPLTGLPNRVLLRERLDHAVLRARRSHRAVAILFADLDHFKQINDLHGHQVGDELLVAVAHRLARLIRSGDTLARWSGDEFVVLCEELSAASHVRILAERIDNALAEPFLLSTMELHMTASVGVAFAGQGEDVPDQVLQDADAAMYRAKERGGAHHQVVDLSAPELVASRVNLAHDLKGAAGRGELRNDYQPIVSSIDGRVTGVEALLRWVHPDRGLVCPATVVPLAEQTGLIDEIGRWVLERACSDRHRWRRAQGEDDLQISVNVSASQLMGPDFFSTVAGVLLDTDTDPCALTLEVTESLFIEDSQRALVVLEDLKQLGVMLALDDFGTGFSSLSYLQRFPVDIVKIDKCFVDDLGKNATSSAIVGAIVDLAHALGMTVVAEGVETAKQYDEVCAIECESCQGYYFARPMSADDLDTQITDRAPGGTLYLPRSSDSASPGLAALPVPTVPSA
ncbi:MAG: EAL domain-containing protein [Actinomycetota bacterium]|nr:EAL domain-containing protein [Actinomycetota bacterium]